MSRKQRSRLDRLVRHAGARFVQAGQLGKRPIRAGLIAGLPKELEGPERELGCALAAAVGVVRPADLDARACLPLNARSRHRFERDIELHDAAPDHRQVVDPRQRRGQQRQRVGLARAEGPANRGAQVLALRHVLRDPGRVAHRFRLELRRREPQHHRLRVAALRRFCFIRFGEPFACVFARALEQVVARRITAGGMDHGLVDQRAQRFHCRALVQGAGAAIAVGGGPLRHLRREAVDEGCESPEHRALVRRQQRVAPVERRAQGLLPRRSRARAGQQPQALAEPLAQTLQPQRGDACGRHLDRQRQAVELATQVDRGIEIGFGEREAAIGRDRSRYQ